MTIEIELLAPGTLPDDLSPELADGLVALRRAADAARDPDDPPVGADVELADLLYPAPRNVQATWVARTGPEVVAVLAALVRVEGENLGMVDLEVEVHPARRREGLVPLLIAEAMPWMRSQDATSVVWWSDEADRGVAESIGLTLRQQERMSRLRVADVDGEQQAAWIEAPTAHAAGYELVTWVGSCPAEHLDAFATACSAMVDAPTDDVDVEPEVVTPDQIVQHDAYVARRGYRTFAALALDGSGRAAGMTAIQVHPGRAWYGSQEDTAVVREHRGFALGRWLKAANLHQVRDAHPELAVVETYNAETNPWMLGINVDMGFRPHRSYFAHQAPIDEIRV